MFSMLRFCSGICPRQRHRRLDESRTGQGRGEGQDIFGFDNNDGFMGSSDEEDEKQET